MFEISWLACGFLEGVLRMSGEYLWDVHGMWGGCLDVSKGKVRTGQFRMVKSRQV